MHPEHRPATPEDAPECVRIRGLTRENAVSAQRLAELGITAESWAEDIRSGQPPGWTSTYTVDSHGDDLLEWVPGQQGIKP